MKIPNSPAAVNLVDSKHVPLPVPKLERVREKRREGVSKKRDKSEDLPCLQPNAE